MAETTAIEWADGTANFWMGCTKISPACDNCYAERDWDHRYARVKWGPHGDRVPVAAGAQVIRKHQRHAAKFIAQHGRKPRIFVNSLSDFADNHKSIDPAWREVVWQLARDCPDVILMILTKRPQNLPALLPFDWGLGYPNIWIGTTAENQEEADRRIPRLLYIEAVRHFLSCEPLLGPINMRDIAIGERNNGVRLDALTGYEWDDLGDRCVGNGLDWVICGGESGGNARPMHPDWARSLRDQCRNSGVPFFFKQWGEFHPADQVATAGQLQAHAPMGHALRDGNAFAFDDQWTWRIGKALAGRLLDGVEHNAMPGDIA